TQQEVGPFGGEPRSHRVGVVRAVISRHHHGPVCQRETWAGCAILHRDDFAGDGLCSQCALEPDNIVRSSAGRCDHDLHGCAGLHLGVLCILVVVRQCDLLECHSESWRAVRMPSSVMAKHTVLPITVPIAAPNPPNIGIKTKYAATDTSSPETSAVETNPERFPVMAMPCCARVVPKMMLAPVIGTSRPSDALYSSGRIQITTMIKNAAHKTDSSSTPRAVFARMVALSRRSKEGLDWCHSLIFESAHCWTGHTATSSAAETTM